MRFFGVSLLMATMAIAGCSGVCKKNLPPAQMMLEPGPGVGGPGPGISVYQPMPPVPPLASQIYFVSPEGMHVEWEVGMPGQFSSVPLVVPARYNFPQGAIYRLKLTDIPGREGVELYPTLEVGPAMPRTQAFLAHNAIPVQFTEEDFDQVMSGNFVTKVIYLPNPEYQALALGGVETLVSTRLEPGVNPIIEAERRGAILAVVRVGNKDLEVPTEEMVPEGEIAQAAYQTPVPCPESQSMAYGMPYGVGPGGPVPFGVPVNAQSTLPGNYISGVTAPQWGMPMCGTPIGLPGPPHVPLGGPAGLQRYSIINHTRVHLPEPTCNVRVDVKQKPGMSYPAPGGAAGIAESVGRGIGGFHQPIGNQREIISAGQGAACDGTSGCGY
jgi:hypothetical protein